MPLNVQSRWLAFAIHLAISVAVLLGLLWVIFFVWFPRDLIFAGGVSGLKIVMGVDLVLGPLLTLIVFNPKKKELKWDLTAIGVLQVGCLAAGLWLVFNERPLVQVLADDGVHLLAASDFDYFEITPPALPGKSPKFVMLDIPENREQLTGIKFTSEFVDERPFAFRSDLYLPMSEQSLSTFESRINFIQQDMQEEQVAATAELPNGDCHWLPIHSKHVFGFACVNYQKGIVRLSDRQF